MPNATRLAVGHPTVATALQELPKDRVPAVVELLCIRSGDAAGLVVPVMATIDELALLVDDLDAAAFDAHDDAEGDGGSYEDYAAAFRKARAAAALLHARRGEYEDAVYEAVHALDGDEASALSLLTE